jgi:pimeloyl-ACP methyl ester carboxylesterase
MTTAAVPGEPVTHPTAAAPADSSGWHRLRSFDGTELAWRVDAPAAGDRRTPVVLCNGIACSDGYWTDVAPRLARHRPVLRWDYRGHGRSGAPEDPGEHHVSSVVADLGCLLDHLGWGPALLVGHSYGVQVVLEAAGEHPRRAAGIGLIAGAPGQPLTRPTGVDPQLLLFPVLGLLAGTAPGLVERAWQQLWRSPAVYWGARVLRGTSRETPRRVMRDYFDHVGGLDPLLLLDMFRSMQAHTAEHVLDTLDVPLLALAGDADGLTPLERMTRLAVRGRGELVIFRGGSHTLPAERPAEVAGHLERLLAQLDADGG